MSRVKRALERCDWEWEMGNGKWEKSLLVGVVAHSVVIVIVVLCVFDCAFSHVMSCHVCSPLYPILSYPIFVIPIPSSFHFDWIVFHCWFLLFVDVDVDVGCFSWS